MQIKLLKLQNIRSYVDETIQFPSGSVLLTGDIGAGKSTILLAIEYALFGTKRGELESTSLLRNGSHAGRIELVLEVDKKEIKIVRTLKRTTQTVKQEAGSIVIDNKRFDLTPMELRARIIALLGYPQENNATTKDLIYRYTVFTPQEQMRQILYEDKETRLNTLRKVFHIDKYKRIRENAGCIAKELRMKKTGIEENIQALPQYEKILNELSITKKEKEEKRQILEKEHKQCSMEKEQGEKIIGAMLEKEKRCYTLQTDIAVSTTTKGKLEREKESIEKRFHVIEQQLQLFKDQKVPQKPEISKTKKEIIQEKEALEKECIEIQQKKVWLLQTKKYFQEELNRLKKDIEKIKQSTDEIGEKKKAIAEREKELLKKEEIEKELQKTQASISLLQEEKTKALMQHDQSLQVKKQIESLQTCTLCLQKVEEAHRHVILKKEEEKLMNVKEQMRTNEGEQQKREEELKRLTALLNICLAAEKNKAVLLSQLQMLQEKQKENDEKEAQLKRTEKSIFQTEEEITVVEKRDVAKKQAEIVLLQRHIEQFTIWEKECALYVQRVQQYEEKEKEKKEVEKEKERIKQEIEGVRQRKEEIEKELSLYYGLQQKIIEEKKRAEKIQKVVQEKRVEFLFTEKEISMLLQEEQKQKQALEQKAKLLQRLQRLKGNEHWLEDFFIPMTTTIEKHVFSQLHGSFSEFFSKWFLMIMDENEMNARLDESFTPIIEQDGYETELFDLSGGEKTAVALAYRLALNKVINEFISSIQTKDIIILDEPTDGFSAEQLDKIREVLDELQLGQIILVSHEQKIESFVENTLRVEKVGYVSKVMI